MPPMNTAPMTYPLLQTATGAFALMALAAVNDVPASATRVEQYSIGVISRGVGTAGNTFVISNPEALPSFTVPEPVDYVSQSISDALFEALMDSVEIISPVKV